MSTIYDRAVRALFPVLGWRLSIDGPASPVPFGGESYYCGGPERRCSHQTCAAVSAPAEADLLAYGAPTDANGERETPSPRDTGGTA